MALFDPIAALALCSAMLLLGLLLRQRRPSAAREPSSRREALDTVQDWPPQATRVLTVAERRAHELLRTALPGMLVLAQVPLSRFLHVPTRHSYVEWMQRVGGLSADLLVCNADSRVLAVIDIRGPAHATHPLIRQRLDTNVAAARWTRAGAAPTVANPRPFTRSLPWHCSTRLPPSPFVRPCCCLACCCASAGQRPRARHPRGAKRWTPCRTGRRKPRAC